MTTVENNAEKSVATNSISPEVLIKYLEMGFKPIPLDTNGEPIMPWGLIYEDPKYWTPEKLSQESYRFKNVATTFGKTYLQNDQGPLYLYALDIDSNEVYNILFRLQNADNPEYSLIPKMQEVSVVVKTRKPNGFHLYWLSHKQHKPVRIEDCKQGFEFEIKAEKACLTLPPSTHRNDPNFHYKNFGQNKLFISDEFYDRLMERLAECLESKRQQQRRTRATGEESELEDAEIQLISNAICPYYLKGRRHMIVFGLSGLFHRFNISKDSAIAVIETLAKEDAEQDRRKAVSTVEETYQRDPKLVAGSRYLLDALYHVTGTQGIAKDIFDKIFRIIGSNQEPRQWLTQEIMKEYTFKTIRDSGKIYYYLKGQYVPGGERIIQEYCQLLYPTVTTHDVQEVVNQINRRTGVDQFDADPSVLNLQNGLLNIDTAEFREHSPDHLSLVQLPINYDPNAECPKILRFLGQVLKPKDIFTALQLIGYSIYKTAKYEKAVMCVGKGDNGKTTFLKLFECFLGLKNVSHASLQELNGDKFAIADLHGKLTNICADLKSEKLTNTGVFKMLVSGDVIRAQKKHGQPFDFSNYAKLIYSANQIPQSDDITYAYFKRWIILIFDRVFMGEERDTILIEKLTTDGELSGLLNLALIALRQLIKDNGFIYTDDIQTVEREYNLNANTIEGFLTEKCSMNTSDRESFGICRDIYHAYVLYCKENKITPLSDNSFGMELAQKHIKKERKMVKGDREYCYIGIKPR
jgi:P4 family phage/plasmid primase-like protien